MRHNTLTVSADPRVGSKIQDAIQDAVELAIRLMTDVAMEFNGVEMHVTPDTDPYRAVEAYHEACRDNRKFVFA